MIHPDTRIQFINDDMGYGVFATKLIPKGTIVYVKDGLDIEVHPEQFHNYHPQLQEQIEKYSFIDERGVRIISWDFAKYLNHCCDCNTLCTGYEFDIAIRDIREGEELTCDYGLLNVEQEMPLLCSRPGCRIMLRPSDFELCCSVWDEKLKPGLLLFEMVEQPLRPFLTSKVIDQVHAFLNDHTRYKSAWALKHHAAPRLDKLRSIAK